MAVTMGVVILIFNVLNNTSVIDAVYVLASYTYGPILGMFAFGIFSPNARFGTVGSARRAAVSGALFRTGQSLETWFNGYSFSYELFDIQRIIYICRPLPANQKKNENHKKRTQSVLRSCCRGSSRQLCRCKPSRSRRMSATGSGTCSPKRPARRSARAGLRSTRWPQTKKRWNSMPATTAPTSRSAKTTSGEFTTVSGELLPAGFKRKEIVLFSDGKRIEELIPARCAAKPTRSRKTLRHEIARAAGHAGGSLPADRRTRRTPIALWQKSRILFRTETEPLGVAAGTYFRDRRRPLHAELRAALPGFRCWKTPGPTS